ncbi:MULTISPECIES: hypothetical protein [Pseudomonas]|uniref:hypothetical protein n=1 Tax=Pseudomonas TaxID=286 RepID=UPI000AE888E2|nr:MULTISPECIES: hypothetical protein [Pseudomonas]
MKNMKAVTFGLLLASSLVYSGAAVSATGTVILRDKDNKICSLPVPEPGQSKTYSFVNDPVLCKDWNDKARTVQLAEVPSATTIFITNNRNCWNTSGEGPWFILKTIKKQTSTSIQEIQYLATFTAKQIVEPGLQMVDLMPSDDGDNLDKISCIRIITSAAPPPSSTTTP